MKNLTRAFRYLSVSKKIIFIGSVLALASAFLPWFEYRDMLTGKLLRFNGFSKYGVFGSLSVFFSMLSIFIMLRESLMRKERLLSIHNSVIWMICASEAIFALIIGIFVFSALFDDHAEAKFRFGLFLSIFAHIFIFSGSHFVYLENKRTVAKESFKGLSEQDLARLNLQPEDPISDKQLSLGD